MNKLSHMDKDGCTGPCLVQPLCYLDYALTTANASGSNSFRATKQTQLTQRNPEINDCVVGSSLAIPDAKLLPDRVLVNVGFQAGKVIAQGADALLSDVIYIHGGVGCHDGSKLSCLAVLQGELTHEAHIPAVT